MTTRLDSKDGTVTTHQLNDQGFSLIELLTVVVIIALLATLAIPNYSRMIDRTHHSSCTANQRAVCRAASMWASETGYGSGTINVGLLQLADRINEESSQCPTNSDGSVDDYFIEFVDGQVASITCDVRPAEHDWSCPL